MLSAVPPDRLGVPRQLRRVEPGRQLGQRGRYDMLYLPSGIVGLPSLGEDTAALLERQSHMCHSLNECKWTLAPRWSCSDIFAAWLHNPPGRKTAGVLRRDHAEWNEF